MSILASFTGRASNCREVLREWFLVIVALASLNFSRQMKNKGRLYFTFILYAFVYLNVVRGSALSDAVLLLVETASMCAFGRQSCSDYQDKLQVLLENVFLQLMTGIKRFNGEILPSAPYGCASDEENSARAKRLKGKGPAFFVPPLSLFQRVKQG